jgi:hypothetical protein
VSVGSLRRLQYINLSNNKLSGALPGLPAGLKQLNIRWGGHEQAAAVAGSRHQYLSVICTAELGICARHAAFRLCLCVAAAQKLC